MQTLTLSLTLLHAVAATTPQPRWQAGVSAIGAEMYVACGKTAININTWSTKLQSMELDSGRWRDHTDVPEAGPCDSAAGPKGRLWVVSQTAVHVYDPRVQRWTHRLNRPTPSMNTVAVWAPRRGLLLLGGRSPRADYDWRRDHWTTADIKQGSVWQLTVDAKKARWKVLPPLPTPDYWHSAVVRGEEVIVLPGWAGSNAVGLGPPHSAGSKPGWRRVSDYSKMMTASVTLPDRRVAVFNSGHGNAVIIRLLSDKATSWQKRPTKHPFAQRDWNAVGAIVHNGQAIIFGYHEARGGASLYEEAYVAVGRWQPSDGQLTFPWSKP